MIREGRFSQDTDIGWNIKAYFFHHLGLTFFQEIGHFFQFSTHMIEVCKAKQKQTI